MDQVDKNLVSANEYNREVENWSRKVKNVSVGILQSGTNSSGKLRRTLRDHVRLDKEQVWASSIGFVFNRYGVFRAYGVGRGYVMENGVVVRGRSVWGDETLRSRFQKRGEKDKDIRKMKIMYATGVIKRKPLDWLDKPIERNINELADIAGEYHGDRTLKRVLEQMDKITIKKKK